jgi:hypothetical protein
MVTLALRVGGGANLLDGSAAHRCLVWRKGMEAARQEEGREWKQKER